MNTYIFRVWNNLKVFFFVRTLSEYNERCFTVTDAIFDIIHFISHKYRNEYLMTTIVITIIITPKTSIFVFLMSTFGASGLRMGQSFLSVASETSGRSARAGACRYATMRANYHTRWQQADGNRHRECDRSMHARWYETCSIPSSTTQRKTFEPVWYLFTAAPGRQYFSFIFEWFSLGHRYRPKAWSNIFRRTRKCNSCSEFGSFAANVSQSVIVNGEKIVCTYPTHLPHWRDAYRCERVYGAPTFSNWTKSIDADTRNSCCRIQNYVISLTK